MESAEASEINWQWFCEACARLGWVEAARANIRAARAHGVQVDVEKVKEAYESHESNRPV